MKKAFAFSITAIALIATWHVYAVFIVGTTIVLPSPIEVGNSIAKNWQAILVAVGLTMFESILGFLVAALAGYALALIFFLSPSLRAALYPYAVALKATPLIAIAPILVIWTGDGIGAKIIMSALVAFFPVLVASYSGLNRYDEEALRFYRVLGASDGYILLHVIMPGSLSYLFSGLKIASTLAVVGAVIAEFVGAQYGAGNLIKAGSYYLNTPLVFATIIALGLASVLFFQLVQFMENRIVFWEEIQ